MARGEITAALNRALANRRGQATVLDRRTERQITTGTVKRFLTDSRQCGVLISDQDIAMDGMIIETPGLSTAQYTKNPVVLAHHDVTRPIGTMTNLHTLGTALHGTVQFAPAGISEDADVMCGLVKAGIVRGVSIGFSVLDYKPGLNGVTRVTRSVLHQVSLVSLPALDSALLTERARSRRDSAEDRRLAAKAVALRFYESLSVADRREMAADRRRGLAMRGFLL